MSLPVAILFVLAGLAILAVGGEVLVRGAVALSKKLRMSTAVIGLTVVALATSLPELAVSLLAALRGSPDVATGNVVGSNIFNMAVILGITVDNIDFPDDGAQIPLGKKTLYLDNIRLIGNGTVISEDGGDGDDDDDGFIPGFGSWSLVMATVLVVTAISWNMRRR